MAHEKQAALAGSILLYKIFGDLKSKGKVREPIGLVGQMPQLPPPIHKEARLFSSYSYEDQPKNEMDVMKKVILQSVPVAGGGAVLYKLSRKNAHKLTKFGKGFIPLAARGAFVVGIGSAVAGGVEMARLHKRRAAEQGKPVVSEKDYAGQTRVGAPVQGAIGGLLPAGVLYSLKKPKSALLKTISANPKIKAMAAAMLGLPVAAYYGKGGYDAHKRLKELSKRPGNS